ncbi:hypothetical protein [Actinopolymorpha sp. B9G3]|uniref:hypothetical protein n=1 Tax=Actinopolymorpha sp. B9G3 TaxID=3158970 RepID=UPI0032D93618
MITVDEDAPSVELDPMPQATRYYVVLHVWGGNPDYDVLEEQFSLISDSVVEVVEWAQQRAAKAGGDCTNVEVYAVVQPYDEDRPEMFDAIRVYGVDDPMGH